MPDQNPISPALKARPALEMNRRGELRAEKFLAAALEVFNEVGYQNARLSDIIQRAGGSMATLYRAFGDKEGLVHALMERSIHNFGQGLEELLNSPLPPAQALEEAALAMVGEILSPAHVVCHRIIFVEGMRQPVLRNWFYVNGIKSMEDRLSEYFARETRAGRLCIEDPDSTAMHFHMMVFGDAIIRSISGPIDDQYSALAHERARSAVRLFLKGALPRN